MGLFDGIGKAISGLIGGAGKAISGVIPKATPPKSSPPKSSGGSPSGSKSSGSKSSGSSSKSATPAIGFPSISLPTLPKVDLPKVDLPKVDLPKVDLPKLKVDIFDTNKAISLPKVGLTGLAIGAGAVGAPAVIGAIASGLPKVDLQAISLPTLPAIALPKEAGSALGSLSSGIDAVIGTRDQMYEQGGTRIGSGDLAGGLAVTGGAAAADILLPMDGVNVANKLLTGRGDELTTEDYAWAALDAITLAAAPFTLGGSYALGRALKAGKVAGGIAGAGKAAGAAADIGKVAGSAGAIAIGAGKMGKFSSILKGLQATRTATKTAGAATTAARTTAKTAGAATTAARRVVDRTPLLNALKASTTTTKAADTAKTFSATESVRSIYKSNDAITGTAKAVDATGDSAAALKGISNTATATKPAGGLKVSPITAALIGTAGLGIGSFLAGSAIGPGEGQPVPPGFPDMPTQDPGQDDAAYIAELEAYIAELEAAIAAGLIPPDEGAEKIKEAEDEWTDIVEAYFPPAIPGSDDIEYAAQDLTRSMDDIPVIGDLLKAARRAGLAAPALALMGITVIGGGYYVVKNRTQITRSVKKALPAGA